MMKVHVKSIWLWPCNGAYSVSVVGCSLGLVFLMWNDKKCGLFLLLND